MSTVCQGHYRWPFVQRWIQCHGVGWYGSVYNWALSAFSKYIIWLNEETLNHQGNRASFVGMCVLILSHCHQSSWCCHVNQRLSGLSHLYLLQQFISCVLSKGHLLLALWSINVLLSGSDPWLWACLSGPDWKCVFLMSMSTVEIPPVCSVT